MENASQLIGDELLVSVFAQFDEGSTFTITDTGDIITAFYHAKKTKGYNELYKNYAFDHDRVFPSSAELDDAISVTMRTQLLGRMNPALKEYHISRGMKIRYNDFIKPKLKKTTITKIEKLANEIKSALDVKVKK